MSEKKGKEAQDELLKKYGIPRRELRKFTPEEIKRFEEATDRAVQKACEKMKAMEEASRKDEA